MAFETHTNMIRLHYSIALELVNVILGLDLIILVIEDNHEICFILQKKCFVSLIDCMRGNSTRGVCMKKLRDCLQDCRKVCPALISVRKD